MDVRLSDRLTAVARLIDEGARLADIGTDHALLPSFLIQTDRISFAIASDIAQGPCEAARRSVAQYGLADRIDVRLGPGLTTVAPGEVDTIVMAGMGGGTAVAILEQCPEVVRHATRIVVQPMNASAAVRRYFFHHGHPIHNELVVEEDGRIYEVMAANVLPSHTDKRADPLYDPFLDSQSALACALDFGPVALSQPTETSLALISETTARWREIYDNMASSRDPATDTKRGELRAKLVWMEAWLIRCETVYERGIEDGAIES